MNLFSNFLEWILKQFVIFLGFLFIFAAFAGLVGIVSFIIQAVFHVLGFSINDGLSYLLSLALVSLALIGERYWSYKRRQRFIRNTFPITEVPTGETFDKILDILSKTEDELRLSNDGHAWMCFELKYVSEIKLQFIDRDPEVIPKLNRYFSRKR